MADTELLVIILGAGRFPDLPRSLSNNAFTNSYESFLEYLDAGFALRAGHLLDLFNSPSPVVEIDGAITRFLQKYKQRTVIIYYVGHGGFLYDRDYFLALAFTRQGKEYLTGYRIADLATTLRNEAGNRDVVLILDCCFAGEAVKEFMPIDVAEIVGKRTIEAVQGASTALLVAASKDKPALAPRGKICTMFTESLISVLREGTKHAQAKLTLQEVCAATQVRIQERYGLQGVRPEVHSPRQNRRDVATVRLFPNPSAAALDSIARKDRRAVGTKKQEPSDHGGIERRLAEIVK
jgi:Caspase domain